MSYTTSCIIISTVQIRLEASLIWIFQRFFLRFWMFHIGFQVDSLNLQHLMTVLKKIIGPRASCNVSYCIWRNRKYPAAQWIHRVSLQTDVFCDSSHARTRSTSISWLDGSVSVSQVNPRSSCCLDFLPRGRTDCPCSNAAERQTRWRGQASRSVFSKDAIGGESAKKSLRGCQYQGGRSY